MTDNADNRRRLRIGDAEREAAVTDLGEHYAAGRLTEEEHANRMEHAYAARTRADLDELFADLPGGEQAPGDEHDEGRAHHRPPWAGQGPPPWAAAWAGPSAGRGKPAGFGRLARWIPLPLLVLAFLGSACAISKGFFPFFVIPLLAIAVTFFVLDRKGCFGGRGPRRQGGGA